MAARWLTWLVRCSTAYPWLTAAVAVVLTAGSLLGSARGLTFQTSNVELLPPSAPYAVRYREHLQEFGELNDIVVVIQAPDPDAAVRYVTRLVGALGGGPIDASRLTYRVDPEPLAARALLYLPVQRLTEIQAQVIDGQDFLEAYAARPTLAQLLESANERLGQAFVSRFLDLGLADTVTADTALLEAVLEQMTGRLAGAAPPYRSPWERLAGGPGQGGSLRYFFSPDSRFLFLFVETRRQRGVFAESRPTVEALRAAVASLRDEFPAVEAGVTGSPAISSDEMVSAFADSRTAGVVALAATLALLLAAFRAVVAPLLMLLTLTVSLAWSLGIVTVTVGHLNVFSVMFVSIVAGLGIDYGIYLLFRAREAQAAGVPLRAALEHAAGRTGPALLLSALTAAAAFLVLTVTGFRGIREFGLVSGVAVLTAFLAMVTLFPALLVLGARRPARPPAVPARGAAAWPRRPPDRPGWILAATGLVTVLALATAPRVSFDDNLLHLQAAGIESVRWEQRMLASGGRTALSALATADTLEELRRKADAFARLPTVARVDSILTVLPDRQSEKLPLVRAIASLVGPLQVRDPPALDAAALQPPVEGLARRLALAVREAPEPSPQLRRLRALAEDLRDALHGPLPPAAQASLGALQDELARDFARQLRRLQTDPDPRALEPADVPETVARRHIGTSGRLLMRIQPAVDVWQQAGAARFVGELRTVDPDVTGAPVITYESTRLMKRAYVEGTLYATLVVLGAAALTFRSALDTLAAAVPLVLGLGWTIGAMPLTGLAFDLANVWALPLLVASGAEYGIALVMRSREAGAAGPMAVGRSTVLAVLLNGLTTIAGFGSLLVAHHRGIFGLGLLLTIGTTASLVAALAVLPALYRVVGRRAVVVPGLAGGAGDA